MLPFHVSKGETEAQEVKQFTQGHRQGVADPSLIFLTPQFAFFLLHRHRVTVIITPVLVHEKPNRM